MFFSERALRSAPTREARAIDDGLKLIQQEDPADLMAAGILLAEAEDEAGWNPEMFVLR